MKKRIYLLLLSFIVIFSSCKDDSGDYVEHLFTNNQISMALQECLRISSDSTLHILFVTDTLEHELGFCYYGSENYRIAFPTTAKQITDTLIAHGFEGMLDTLLNNVNLAAELCGDKLKRQFLDTTIKTLVFPDPKLILRGGNSAATNFFKEKHQSEFLSLLVTNILIEQFNQLEVIQSWNALQETYYQITGKYVSIEILSPSAQQVMDGFFKFMALVEEAIRKNPELRGKPDGLFNRVFDTL